MHSSHIDACRKIFFSSATRVISKTKNRLSDKAARIILSLNSWTQKKILNEENWLLRGASSFGEPPPSKSGQMPPNLMQDPRQVICGLGNRLSWLLANDGPSMSFVNSNYLDVGPIAADKAPRTICRRRTHRVAVWSSNKHSYIF